MNRTDSAGLLQVKEKIALEKQDTEQQFDGRGDALCRRRDNSTSMDSIDSLTQGRPTCLAPCPDFTPLGIALVDAV